MKTHEVLVVGFALAVATMAFAQQPAATPDNAQPTAPAVQPADATTPAPTNNVISAATNNVAPAATNSTAPNATSAATPVVTNESSLVATNADRPLHLNFRNAPLELVLKYLSEAAGFIILPETEVRGTIDVWSNQPLTKEEAVDVLNSVLKKNGYTAIRNGRSLKIVSRAEAKTSDVPVKSGNDPQDIPKNDEMVTQVIPVKHANAQQLIQNLGPLLPEYARDSFSANESGNSLLITATQADIRRMVEIVKALDDSISGTSNIKVYPLKFADAKEVANAIKELFQPQTTQGGGQGGGNRQNNPFFGGGGAGGFGGGGFGGGGFGGGGNFGGGRGNFGGGGGGRGGRTGGTAANIRVNAVPDEHSNSVIVSGPEDVMPTIDKLINEIDVAVADITELRVFFLNHANPIEMSELLYNLFPDETRDSNNNTRGGGFQFNPFGGGGNRGGGNRGGGNRGGGAAADSSERAKKQGRVLAVPDQRTSSIIVSAAKDMMPQIAQMIEQLDANPAKKQQVMVYEIQNADVQQLGRILQDQFTRSANNASRNNRNEESPLVTRNRANSQVNNPGGTVGNGFGQNANNANRTFGQ